MEISRHAIRECAFQTLFALASDPEIDREAIYAERLGLKPDEEVPAYLPELVNGVLAHQDELDAQIESKLAPGWTLSRLARPDLVILRLALYELEYTQFLFHKANRLRQQLGKLIPFCCFILLDWMRPIKILNDRNDISVLIPAHIQQETVWIFHLQHIFFSCVIQKGDRSGTKIHL